MKALNGLTENTGIWMVSYNIIFMLNLFEVENCTIFFFKREYPYCLEIHTEVCRHKGPGYSPEKLFSGCTCVHIHKILYIICYII